MRIQGIEVLQERSITVGLVGMHKYFNPRFKDFCLEIEIERWLKEAHSKGFESIYISGPSQKRIYSVLNIMLERAEEEAREPVEALPTNVITVDFKNRRVA